MRNKTRPCARGNPGAHAKFQLIESSLASLMTVSDFPLIHVWEQGWACKSWIIVARSIGARLEIKAVEAAWDARGVLFCHADDIDLGILVGRGGSPKSARGRLRARHGDESVQLADPTGRVNSRKAFVVNRHPANENRPRKIGKEARKKTAAKKGPRDNRGRWVSKPQAPDAAFPAVVVDNPKSELPGSDSHCVVVDDHPPGFGMGLFSYSTPMTGFP